MPFVTMNSAKYHYEANMPPGEPRQAILFVHGAGGSHQHWRFQLSSLGVENLSIAVDLPEHGLSGGKALDSISGYSRFIEDFADRLLGTPFILAGHSMGGAIAMDFALNNPDRLAGLILVGTGSRLRVMPQLLEAFKNGKVFTDLVRFAYGPDTPEELLSLARQEMENVHPTVSYADFTACDNFNIDDDLDRINVPTLVIAAGNDVMTPVKYGKRLTEKIPGAKMAVISGAGHMMMLEQPEQFNTTVAEFVRSLDFK